MPPPIPAPSLWERVRGAVLRLTLRKLLWLAVAGLWGFVVSLALQKGWADSIPDPIGGALFIGAALLFIGLVWTDRRVKKHRNLIYTYPPMSFLSMVAIGMVFGAAVIELTLRLHYSL
jgi:hypothetical protein